MDGSTEELSRDFLIEQLASNNDLQPVERQEFLFYVMGPYRTIDLDYFLSDTAKIDPADMEYQAYEPDDKMIDILNDVVEFLRKEGGINAFTALNVDIPLPGDDEVDDDDIVMNAIEQSQRFGWYSNATCFLLPFGGLRDGVDLEVGAVLENNLSDHLPKTERRDSDRYIVIREKNVKSTTLNSVELRWNVAVVRFETSMEVKLRLLSFAYDIILQELSGDLDRL